MSHLKTGLLYVVAAVDNTEPTTPGGDSVDVIRHLAWAFGDVESANHFRDLVLKFRPALEPWVIPVGYEIEDDEGNGDRPGGGPPT